jgi:hypothetical protein
MTQANDETGVRTTVVIPPDCGRSHVNDPFNKFRLFKPGRRFIPAFELVASKLIAGF